MPTLEQRYKALLAEKPGGGFFGGGKQPQDPFVETLLMDGLRKVINGMTTLEEVIRVVELPD